MIHYFFTFKNPKLSFILSFLLVSLTASAEKAYSFYLLSDLHWGAPETYHQQFRGNPQRAQLSLPAYENMFQHMAQNAADTQFLLQLGDMIEGNAKGKKEHAQQLTEAITLLKKHFPFPICHVRGNHDAYGHGGREAAQEILLPEMARTVNKKKLPHANYSFTCGPDLFIIADFYRSARSDDFILQTLKTQKKKPRYVFIAIHCPVISLTTPAFADALAEYNAIVLSGHIHMNYLLQYTKNNKTMTQVTLSSRLPAQNGSKQRARLISRDKKSFKKLIRRQAEKFKKTSFMSLYEKEWEPFLSVHQFSGSGYVKVNVSDNGITLQYQGADVTSKPVTATIKINK